MSSFVCIDACVAAKWVLPEEGSDLALEIYRKSREQGLMVIAPPHMPVEVVNAIRRRVARELITQTEADELLSAFLDFSVSLATPAGLYESALRLAEQFDRPTIYDTHYVALAQIAGCDLWTADMRLLNALDGRLRFVKPLDAYRP